MFDVSVLGGFVSSWLKHRQITQIERNKSFFSQTRDFFRTRQFIKCEQRWRAVNLHKGHVPKPQKGPMNAGWLKRRKAILRFLASFMNIHLKLFMPTLRAGSAIALKPRT